MARTRSVESQGTRQRIADAALEQFQLKGFNGTSVQDLVDAADAPKGSFYNHFASKEDLAAETVRRYSSDWNLSALADSTAGTPRARIDRHLAELIAIGRGVAAERGCLVANFAGEVPAHSPLVTAAVGTHLVSWVETLTSVIDEAKLAGEVTSTTPAIDLAEFIVNAWEGGAVKAKATGSEHSIDVFERMVDLLLR
jgi:TetR/AcrR family transcriptional repressor of nem operon